MYFSLRVSLHLISVISLENPWPFGGSVRDISKALITGAQPKAETGHKMQSISVVFSTLHCEGYIADLRYRWLITSGIARWLAH